ncbi:MAG TPA: HNH endonuclease signature motif containing protein [Nocardioidaceae bacterium]|nr:HNH endonuclease signature motif containing protein [Nocardioidaceae bacterium]
MSRADDGRTLAQRRADAFGEIAMAGIAAQTTGPSDGTSDGSGASGGTSDGSGASGGTSGSGGRPRRGRLRAQIAATVPTEYLAGMPGAPKPLLAHFGLIPSATAHRLVCDGDLTRVILDTATGKPLNVGRRHRLAVARQVRALGVAFRHCAFPGCEVPFRFTEIHHRDWWCRDNGATDLDLLLPYCWTHHHFVHEYGFTVTKHHGQLVHRRPDGRTIPGPDQFLRAAVTQLSIDTATTRNATDSTDSTTTGTGTSTGTGTGTTEKADRPANTSADPPDESRDPPSAA